MIIDSSAVVAVLRLEPDVDVLQHAMRSSARSSMSAANVVETGIVIDRDPVLRRQFDELLDHYEIGIVPVTAQQTRIARQAYLDFGKGTGHRAQLNFGDCFAYALALDAGEPLLYKGDDFVHTGIRSALAGT